MILECSYKLHPVWGVEMILECSYKLHPDSGIDASFYLISKILGQDWAKAVAKNLEYPYSTR